MNLNTITLPTGHVVYTCDLSPEYCSDLLEKAHQLVTQLLTLNPLYVRSMGARKSVQCGKDYFYSKKTTYGIEVPPFIQEVLNILNERFPTEFNSCLINMYPHGVQTGIGQHMDNEDCLYHHNVATISLGSACDFEIGGMTIHLPVNSLLLIPETTNLAVSHGIRKYVPTATRISLTFRKMK